MIAALCSVLMLTACACFSSPTCTHGLPFLKHSSLSLHCFPCTARPLDLWSCVCIAPDQVTVNNQIVIGTLMNICDEPKRVSIGQDWLEKDVVRRTPIVVTGGSQ